MSWQDDLRKAIERRRAEQVMLAIRDEEMRRFKWAETRRSATLASYRCKHPGCDRTLSAINKSGYCADHWGRDRIRERDAEAAARQRIQKREERRQRLEVWRASQASGEATVVSIVPANGPDPENETSDNEPSSNTGG